LPAALEACSPDATVEAGPGPDAAAPEPERDLELELELVPERDPRLEREPGLGLEPEVAPGSWEAAPSADQRVAGSAQPPLASWPAAEAKARWPEIHWLGIRLVGVRLLGTRWV
jgi:hypothetical protein